MWRDLHMSVQNVKRNYEVYHLLLYQLHDRVHESLDSIFSIDHRFVSLKNSVILALSHFFVFFV